MIGMTGENGDGAVKLFGDQNTNDLVRPCELAEIKNGRRSVVKCRILAVGATNRNHEVALAAITQIAKNEAKAGLSSALPRSSNSTSTVPSARCFPASPLLRACASPRSMPGFPRPRSRAKLQPDRRAGLGKAFDITGRKILFRAGFQPSHRKIEIRIANLHPS